MLLAQLDRLVQFLKGVAYIAQRIGRRLLHKKRGYT